MVEKSPPHRRRRFRRLLVWTAAAVVLGIVFVAGAALWMLHAPAGRRAVLARAAAYLEDTWGVAATAADFRLDARAGRLTIRELTIGAPGHEPLLRVGNLVLEVEPRSLLGAGPVVVGRFLADGVVADLAAPFPELPDADTEPPAEPGPLPEIAEFAVTNARILPGPVPEAAAAYLAGWGVPELTLRGSLTRGEIAVHTAATLELQRPGGPSLPLHLEAAATGPAMGPWRLDELSLVGEGLRLAAAGVAGSDPGHPLQGEFTITLDEPPLAPELAGSGTITIQGRADARTETGTLKVEAPRVALEVLAPYLDADTFAAAGLAGTTASLDVNAEGGPGWQEAFTVRTRLRWEQDSEILTRGTVTLRREAGREALDAVVAAEFLPGESGRRTLTATALIADPARPEQAVIRRSTLTLAIPDLAAAAADLRRRWPVYVPELPAETPLQGSLDLTARASGAMTSPQVTGSARWRPEPGTEIAASFEGQPTVPRGRVDLTAEALPLHLLDPAATGLLSVRVQAAGDLNVFAGSFSITGHSIQAGEDLPPLDHVSAFGEFDQDQLTLDQVEARSGETELHLRGRVGLDLPLRRAHLAGSVDRIHPGISRIEAEMELDDGVLTIPFLVADTSAGPMGATLIIPLGALAAIPELAAALAEAPLVQLPGPVFVELHVPELDTVTLLPLFEMDPLQERIRGELHAALWLDPAQPTLASGTLRLTRLTAAAGEAVVTAEGPVEFTLAGGTVRLLPVSLATPGARLELKGEAFLDPNWTPEAPPEALITGFAGEMSGSINTALANPFLEGGVAQGILWVAGEVTGTPADPKAVLALAGPAVEVFWPLPYPTRVTEPTFQVEWRDGRAEITTGFLRVNRGTVDLGGTITAAGEVDLALFLADLRYRLDYGLMADVSGDLRLRTVDEGLLLSGRIVLDRGVLDRDIELDRELLAQFLAPAETVGTEADPLEAVALDLRLETVHGVRVRNNVADLLATWAPLSITGTAFNPVLRGRVELERGGLVFAYGQTLRIDRGRMVFTGDPFLDPLVDLATTSSLQDPTITSLPGDLGALQDTRGDVDLSDALTSGMAGYVGERLGAKVAQAVGLSQVSLRPVMVFGETDPSARLTVTQDLSRNASFAVSLDLRNAERQVYILDLHGFRRLPRFTAQLFTTEAGKEGSTVQQVLELGGARRRREELPVLRRLVVPELEGVSRRSLRRAIRLRRGEPVPAAAPLDVELDVAQWLRERGYPEAQVTVATRPTDERRSRVDLEVSVEPGPRAEFRFEGDRPPRWARRSITTLYRADFFEAASLEEMRRRTVRVFRTLGHIRPQVEITLAPAADDPDHRVVTVAVTAGERASLQHLEVIGLPADEAALLASRFPGPLERAELAAGTPDARRRVIESLRALGYPEGQPAEVTLSPNGREVALEVNAGAQARLAEVAVRGVNDGETARLQRLLALAPGDPARRDLLTMAALTLEEDLLTSGYPDARVRTVVTPIAPDRPLDLVAAFEVTRGAQFTLGEVTFQGLRGTRQGFARRIAGLEPGVPFQEQELGEARSRLFQTGLFAAVAADSFRTPDGLVRVNLAVEERPRWIIGYGVRLESGGDVAGVVDVIDHNFLGRALTAGTRLLYESNRQSGRLYLRTPELATLGANVETYAERRRVVRGMFQEDVTEAAVQLSRPLTRHLTGRVYARWADTLISEREPDPFFPFPDIRIRHPYAGLQVMWDTRDSPFLASQGAFASLDVSGSGSLIGSDFKYVRAYGQFNLFQPTLRLGDREVVWAQSLRAGLARAFDQELLSSVRFFAGGEFSVRGYPWESLGPRQWDWSAGEFYATGGEAMLVLNQELRIPLLWDVSGLVFVDAGQVWGDSRDFPSSLATSTGFGFRAMTPIGVLRLDVAFPLDRRPDDPRHRIYAGFGTTF